jgi:hypothetical protein
MRLETQIYSFWAKPCFNLRVVQHTESCVTTLVDLVKVILKYLQKNYKGHKVTDDGAFFEVSWDKETAEIGNSHVASVTFSKWQQVHPKDITFAEETEFIRFMRLQSALISIRYCAYVFVWINLYFEIKFLTVPLFHQQQHYIG